MAYIGFNPSQLAIAPFATKYFTGDGVTTTFTLDQSVPGANEANVEVFVENVQQNPIDAYTIGGALNNQLIFSEAPVTGAAIYVIHKGEATYNLQPSTGSVTAATLDPVLRNFTVDKFTGNGSTTAFTLSDTPYSPNSILVSIDGIVQQAGTNYTVSGTTLTFASEAPDTGSDITVVHLGFSSGNKAVMDASITPVKLSTGGPSWSTAGVFSVSNQIGVGTTTPTQKLETVGNIKINGASNANVANLIMTRTDASWRLANETDLRLYSANSNTDSSSNLVAAFTSAGRMGLGTTSPSWMLHLKGQFPYICFEDTDNANGIQATVTANQDGNMYYDANINNTATPGGHIWRANGGGIYMMLEQNVVGSSAGRLNLPYGQIKFPAAQNASSDPNTLDDYEEGTWTPTIYTESGTNFTITSSDCRYTKVGNKVYINAVINYSAKGSQALAYVSLPLATTHSAGMYFTGACSTPTANNLSDISLLHYASNIFAYFRQSNADSYYFSNISFMASSGTIRFNGTYFV